MIDICIVTRAEGIGLVPAGHAEPDWANCYGVVEDGEVTFIFGQQKRLVAEPLYGKPGHHAAALLAMGSMDGIMRALAAANGLSSYEFFIGDDHPEFQKFVEKHLPVKGGREKPGMMYQRQF